MTFVLLHCIALHERSNVVQWRIINTHISHCIELQTRTKSFPCSLLSWDNIWVDDFVISLMTWEGVSSGVQCNAMQKVHKCYYSVHNIRSFLQCNAKCYLFNEHVKELVLMCIAIQKVHGLCYLFNKHLKEEDLVCTSMQCQKCIP